MKKNLVLLTVLSACFTASASFADVRPMSCVVESPCDYAASENLGYCVKEEFDIRGEPKSDGSLQMTAVIGKQSEIIGQDIFRIAAMIPVNRTIEEGYNNIKGSSNEGENWISLQPKNLSRFATTYFGSLTLEEDFEFAVTCEIND